MRKTFTLETILLVETYLKLDKKNKHCIFIKWDLVYSNSLFPDWPDRARNYNFPIKSLALLPLNHTAPGFVIFLKFRSYLYSQAVLCKQIGSYDIKFCLHKNNNLCFSLTMENRVTNWYLCFIDVTILRFYKNDENCRLEFWFSSMVLPESN